MYKKTFPQKTAFKGKSDLPDSRALSVSHTAGFGTVKSPVAKASLGQNPPPFLISYYVIGSYYIVYFS